jgi:hypothetical protein
MTVLSHTLTLPVGLALRRQLPTTPPRGLDDGLRHPPPEPIPLTGLADVGPTHPTVLGCGLGGVVPVEGLADLARVHQGFAHDLKSVRLVIG